MHRSTTTAMPWANDALAHRCIRRPGSNTNQGCCGEHRRPRRHPGRPASARVRAEVERLDRVEDVQHRVELGKRCLQRDRVRVWQFQISTGQAEATLGKLGAELFGTAQVADRAEIDAGITGGADLVQDGVAVGNIRVEPMVTSNAP